MKFDSVTTNIVETTQNSIYQLAEFVSDNQSVFCDKLVVGTNSGSIVIESTDGEIEIHEVKNES